MIHNRKKAEMGVGTLIVFIAMLLVAAVAAGVLIQTAGALQEKSLATGQQARAQISTNARVIEVSATDGRNGNLTDFQQILKLSPGSDPIKLTQIIFTFNTKDSTSTLHYRGTDGVCELNNQNGYNTWNRETIEYLNTSFDQFPLEEDLDDDGYDDYIYVLHTGGSGNNVSIGFNLSSRVSDGWFYNIYEVGKDISNASSTPVNFSWGSTPIYNGSASEGKTPAQIAVVGYLTMTGSTNVNNSLANNISIEIDPYHVGEGYFVAMYEQTGTNHVAGNLQRGDVIRLCYESPSEIVEDDEVRLNFIPKIGTATLTQFVTPDVISTERVYLYP